MNPKLLFVGWELPPRRGPHALRLGYFSKYLAEMGWELDAIGAAPSVDQADEGLASLMPSDAWVERPPVPVGRLASIRWARSAIRIGKRMVCAGRPDVILSSVPQFVSHLVGHKLARWSKVPWVADYGDPFTNNPGYSRGRIYQSLVRQMEKRWVNLAERICVTTRTTEEDYHRAFPATMGKTEYIPLGYEPAEFANLPLVAEPDSFFRLTFAGSLHLNTTDGPHKFYRAVVRACQARPDLVNRLRVEFIQAEGAREIMAEIVPADQHKMFEFTPFVPYNQVLNRLKASSCLMMWGNKDALQVPSKVYIYFGLKKPILAICPNRRDPLRSLVLDNRRGVVVSDSVDKIAGQLLELIDLHASGRLTENVNMGEVPEYMWRAITAKLDVILRDVAGRNSDRLL